MKKVKNTIPVYDICTLGDKKPTHDDIIVEGLSGYLQSHPNLYFPHRHSFYHMVLFTSGAGTHSIDFEQFSVQAGQGYFMVPGQVHSWHFDGVPEGYIINFSGEFFHSFLADQHYLEQFPFFGGVATESVLQLPGSAIDRACELCRKMIAELNSNTLLREDLLRCYLAELFIGLGRECNTSLTAKVPHHNQLILLNFRKLTDQYFALKRLPKEYAEMLYITPNHLNALCQDLLGKPAGEVIRDRVLLEAKRLLVNQEQSITEIAWQLNFADNSYFTKFFKKYTGLTPEEFRTRAGLSVHHVQHFTQKLQQS